jgi:hypothetical protein
LRFETFYRIAEELERLGQWNPDALEESPVLDSASIVSPRKGE